MFLGSKFSGREMLGNASICCYHSTPQKLEVLGLNGNTKILNDIASWIQITTRSQVFLLSRHTVRGGRFILS